jgi:hypothetical protein
LLPIVAVFGALIILACGLGFAKPKALLDMAGRFANRAGLAVAIVLRLLLGAVALFAAPESRSPMFLYVVGTIALIAAVVLPVIGVAGYRRIIAWVASFEVVMLRVWLLCGLTFGAALVWVSGIF